MGLGFISAPPVRHGEAEDGREFAQLLHQIVVPRGEGEARDQFKQFHHRQNDGNELGDVNGITPLSFIKI